MRDEVKMDANRLIAEVHKRPALWNQRHISYHNREVTNRVWMEIASIFKLPSQYICWFFSFHSRTCQSLFGSVIFAMNLYDTCQYFTCFFFAFSAWKQHIVSSLFTYRYTYVLNMLHETMLHTPAPFDEVSPVFQLYLSRALTDETICSLENQYSIFSACLFINLR